MAGATKPGYSPVDDPISRLAAVGSSTRVLMTVGLLTFSLGTFLYAMAVRPFLPGGTWVAAFATSLATVGVIVFPLDRSATGDQLHAVFAIAAYIALALTPALAARPLASSGRDPLAQLSAATGVLCGLCLAITLLGAAPGLFQRIGLTLGHGWIAGSAAWMLLRDRHKRHS